jgi:hypothetical protein
MVLQKIIIMDFATQEVHIFSYDPNIWGENGEHFLLNHHSRFGQIFKPEECEWMIVDLWKTEEVLPIYIH